jgi:hypothetical protein
MAWCASGLHPRAEEKQILRFAQDDKKIGVVRTFSTAC